MTREATDKKHRVSNGFLLAILGVLVVVIIVLTASVVMCRTRKITGEIAANEGTNGNGSTDQSNKDTSNKNEDNDEGGENTSGDIDVKKIFDENEGDDVGIKYAVMNSVSLYYEDNENFDDSLAIYDEALSVAQERELPSLQAELYTDTASFMATHDYCEDAMNYLDGVDVSGFDQSTQLDFYNNSFGVAMHCKDESSAEKWQTLYNNLNSANPQGVVGG